MTLARKFQGQARTRAITALGAVVILAGLVTRACADPRPKDGGEAGSSMTASSGASGQHEPQGGSSSGTSSSVVAGASGAGDVGGQATSPPTDCGNGDVDAGEECDDGNDVSGDGCSSSCTSACETCERDTCPTTTPFTAQPWYTYAYDMDGKAAAGPKTGTPRGELVRSVLACIYDSKCTAVFSNDPPITSQISLRECFCKNAPAGTEPATYPDICKHEATLERGPCIDQMLAASETDNVEAMLTKLTNLGTPLGRAFYLLQHCDARVCGGECLPTETGL
jgi:cysteine-rich repeat protein